MRRFPTDFSVSGGGWGSLFGGNSELNAVGVLSITVARAEIELTYRSNDRRRIGRTGDHSLAEGWDPRDAMAARDFVRRVFRHCYCSFFWVGAMGRETQI